MHVSSLRVMVTVAAVVRCAAGIPVLGNDMGSYTSPNDGNNVERLDKRVAISNEAVKILVRGVFAAGIVSAVIRLYEHMEEEEHEEMLNRDKDGDGEGDGDMQKEGKGREDE